MRRTTAVGVVGLLCLAGCAGGNAAQREVSSAQSSALEAQAWTPAEAGQKYLDMINPSNVDANALAGLSDTTPLADYQAALSLLGNDAGLFAEQLAAGNWPTVAHAAIMALIPAVKAEQVAVQKAITATTVAQVKSELQADAAVIGAAKTRSAAVRVALGLPAS